MTHQHCVIVDGVRITIFLRYNNARNTTNGRPWASIHPNHRASASSAKEDKATTCAVPPEKGARNTLKISSCLMPSTSNPQRIACCAIPSKIKKSRLPKQRDGGFFVNGFFLRCADLTSAQFGEPHSDQFWRSHSLQREGRSEDTPSTANESSHRTEAPREFRDNGLIMQHFLYFCSLPQRQAS